MTQHVAHRSREEDEKGEYRMAEKTVGITAWNAADDQKLRATHLFTSESVTEGPRQDSGPDLQPHPRRRNRGRPYEQGGL